MSHPFEEGELALSFRRRPSLKKNLVGSENAEGANLERKICTTKGDDNLNLLIKVYHFLFIRESGPTQQRGSPEKKKALSFRDVREFWGGESFHQNQRGVLGKTTTKEYE